MDHPFLSEIRALTPLIRSHRSWGEEHFRMAPKVRSALGAIGTFRMTAPLELGGLEVPLPVEVRVTEELAFADPAVSWVVGNSNAIGSVTARLDEAAGRRLLSDPTAVYGFGLAPTGKAEVAEGGYQVSGEWPVVSGCREASWFLMASKVYEGEEQRVENRAPQIRFLALPASEVEILDTWSDVVAVRGSGSHAVRVRGSFVPETMAVNMAAAPRIDRPRYRFGAGGVGSLSTAATTLGIARAAVEAVIHQAGERVSVVSGAPWREWPSVQDSVASVDADVFCAREGLFAIAEEFQASAESGRPLPPGLRARAHAMGDHGVRVAREGVSRLFACGSIDAIHAGHGLEQSLRDVHAFSVQWERYRRLHFEAGRVLLGADPRDPQF